MKNVYIIDDYASSKINGIGTYIKELIFCLKKIVINICLISFSYDTKKFIIEMDNGIKRMQFPTNPGFFDQYYNVVDKFFRLYFDDSPENVFFFNHTPNDFFIKKVKSSFPLSKLIFVIHDMIWTGFMLGDKTGIKKYVNSEIKNSFEKKYPVLFPLFESEKCIYETAHRIIVLAPETVESLQSVYNISNQKISLILNGLQDSYHHISEKEKIQLKEKLFIPFHEKIIIFVGRVEIMKGIFSVINSLKKIVIVYPNVRLVAVGTIFESKKIMECAGEIVSKLIFTGQISKEKLHEWYQIADIGVLASYSEQCNFTGIEMMMHGLPVVASDGFGVGDMFKDGVNAKVARIGDRNHPEEFENNLSKAFLELLQSPDLCEKLGKEGRKIYETKYHINNMKEGYRMLLDSL